MTGIRVFICPLLLFGASPIGAATFEELQKNAMSALAAHDTDHAIELYRSATDLRPDWQPGWWFLGMLLYSRGQYADSRGALQHLASLNDRSGEAWGLMGMCEAGLGQWTDALAHIQKGLALGAGSQPPLGDVLRSNEALLLTKTGKFDLALERYLQFLHAGAPSEDLVAGVGLAALRRPLLPSEIPAQDKDLVTLAGQAYLLNVSGKAQAAEPFFRDLLARYPAVPGVHYLFASWLMRKDEDAAIAELHRELEISPGNAGADELLAWILLMKTDYSSAFPYALAAERADPASPVAQYDLGRAFARSGRVQEGIRHLEVSASLDPNNLETEITLAHAYAMAGRYADAARLRREALSLKEAAHAAARP